MYSSTCGLASLEAFRPQFCTKYKLDTANRNRSRCENAFLLFQTAWPLWKVKNISREVNLSGQRDESEVGRGIDFSPFSVASANSQSQVAIVILPRAHGWMDG